MANKHLIISILALCFLAASCSKPAEPATAPETGRITFSCVLEPDSKAAISDQGKVTWEPGDEILIHGKWAGGKYSSTVTLEASGISADGRTATFTVDEYTTGDAYHSDGLSDVYAIYPASAAAVDNGKTNWRSVNKFNESNLPLMIGYNTSRGGTTIVFRNVCGVISFKVSGDFDSYEFSGNDNETVAYEGLQSRLYLRESAEYSNWIYAGTPLTKVSGSMTADGSTVNYVCIPAGADFSKGFSFRFKKNGTLVKTAKSNTAVNVARSHLLNLGDISSHLEDPTEEEMHESDIDIDNATDLSASETANCYIVSAPGDYKFHAVQGCGNASVGTVAGVQVLWETCCNADPVSAGSIISAVDFQDDWICFSTPSTLKPGNALIAAKNNEGSILWSWHIWIPADTIESSTYGLATHAFMDRNLGALDAVSDGGATPESFGLLYQWGRKDPFIGARAAGTNTTASSAGVAMTANGGQMSMAEAIANPTVFANVTSGNDWCSTTSGDYWGDTSDAKTIWDPCPAGYRIPKREDAAGLFRTDLTTVSSFVYDSDKAFFTIGEPLMYFPLCGYIDYTNANQAYSGVRTVIWNSHHDSNSTYAAYSQYVYAGPTSKTYSMSKARAASVRCITIDEVPFENAEGMPVIGSYTRQDLTGVAELSGLCFSKDKDFVWGAGDQGDVYKIYLSDFTYTKQLATGSDLEDVTIHPVTGDLYFAKEPDRVDKIAAPDYNKKTQVFTVTDASSFGNSGMEGIAYYKDDILYLGAQTSATLWAYTISGTLIWKKQLGSIAPSISEVGGLCYDAQTDLLWVTDSEVHKLFIFNGEVTKLLAVYDIPYIGNAESVLVDHDRSCVWVGDDNGTSNSRLYKISFTGL